MLICDILREKGDQVYHVGPEETVYRAIEKMAEKDIGALLVVESGQVVGIISERDYRNKVILKGRTSKTTPVRDIMSSEVFWVSPSETVENCLALMTERKFRHLPVIQNNTLAGIVSIGDLVKAVISQQKVEIFHLRHYITGTYPV